MARGDFTILRKSGNEFWEEIRVGGEVTNAVITADSGCNPNQMRDRVVSPFLDDFREHLSVGGIPTHAQPIDFFSPLNVVFRTRTRRFFSTQNPHNLIISCSRRVHRTFCLRWYGVSRSLSRSRIPSVWKIHGKWGNTKNKENENVR